MKRLVATCLAGLLVVGLAWAVESANVEQASTEDFAEGTFEDVVVNNLGELKLARKTDLLLKGDKDVVFVNAAVTDDRGNTYVATAPKGKLFRISANGTCELWYTAKEKTLQSLALGPKGELYLGTGGGEGRIYRVTAKDTAEVVCQKDGLAYVWSMAVLPSGKIVAGTGPNAELLIVGPDSKAAAGEVLFKSEKGKQKNILAVAADAAGQTIYFGTDTDGLVFKYDVAARKPFLMYDADESEVACLAVAPDGSVYAGTSDPRSAEGGRASEGSGSGPGRVIRMGGGDDAEDESADDDDDKDDSADDDDDDDDDAKKDTGEPAGKTVAPSPRQDKPGVNKAVTPAPSPSVALVAGKTAPATQPTRPAKGPSSQPTGEPRDTVVVSSGGPGRSIRMPRGPSGGSGGGEGGGNAVYRINARGFVAEVVRQPVMMLALLLQGDRLIIGTGGDGRVLSVTAGSEEVATLAKFKDVKQVMALSANKDGEIFAGTANDAVVARIGKGFAAKGTFTSKPIDAKFIARWGVITERSNTSGGGTVRVQTRSGNLAEPEDALWSAWSEPVAASDPATVSSPAARFIQYRVVLTSDAPDATPAVKAVAVSFVSENQAPKLTAAKAVAPGANASAGGSEGGESRPSPPSPRAGGKKGGSSPVMLMSGPSRGGPSGGPSRRPSGDSDGPQAGGSVEISWTATDANEDTLEYMLYFRKAGSQVWVALFDKPIRDDNYSWSTHGLPDGQYQVKIVASDLPSNPAGSARQDTRLTDLFTVDNTPPTLNNLRIVETKGAKVTIAADAADALTRLASAHAKVDSVAIDGQVVEPTDGIWDQKAESLRFTVDLGDKPAAGHMVILTVTDAAGNVASGSVEVAKP